MIDKVEKQYGGSFASVYKTYSEGGKSSLRRLQYKHAQRNPAMCIWLGKNWLGQKDTPPEQIINEAIDKKFEEHMEQLKLLQSCALKKEQINSSAEHRS